MSGWQVTGFAWMAAGGMLLMALAWSVWAQRREAADAAEADEDRELGEALARLRHPSSGPTGRMWR